MQILGLFGMNFDALVFVTKFSLLFRLALASDLICKNLVKTIIPFLQKERKNMFFKAVYLKLDMTGTRKILN